MKKKLVAKRLVRKTFILPEHTGCYWDAREYGLSGDLALSAAISCWASHGFKEIKYKLYEGMKVLHVEEKYYSFNMSS
jgi:hypothetical protein